MVAPAASRLRASDADRDRAVLALKRGLVEGRLSYDSFVGRVEVALQARESDVLDDVLAGLPTGLRQRLLLRWQAAAASLPTGSRADRLTLPTRLRPALLIGRDADCDLVLSDTTVSRRHASLMRFGSGWFVLDHGSTNGTWLNGRPVSAEASVHAGDRLRLGKRSFRLVAAEGR